MGRGHPRTKQKENFLINPLASAIGSGTTTGTGLYMNNTSPFGATTKITIKH